MSTLKLYKKMDTVLFPGTTHNIKGIVEVLGIQKISQLADNEDKRIL